ncbi:hypothetical protein GGR53DRAFT_222574 [Hypoxylon sp. FL1150]|nr:hypothetical protein GGR53DRAFT_222574 [Hypoxylon sp. FL1150]
MPLPLPVPSKAAIHALRGIALGTSCAIGVIVEDRRRKISILRTAISNKEKLRSAKQYHGKANPAALQLDENVSEDELHWHQFEDSPGRAADDYPLVEGRRRPSSIPYDSLKEEAPVSLGPRDVPEPSSSPTSPRTQLPSSQHTRNIAPSLSDLRRLPTYLQTRIKSAVPIREQRSGKVDQVIEQINRILAGKDEERLDRALRAFFGSFERFEPFEQSDDKWVALAALLSKKCQEESRWEDATKVLSVIIYAGPLDEKMFYNHNPIPIMEFWLSRTDEKGRCPPEAIATASHLFLASFKKKPQYYAGDIERIGTRLLSLNLQSHNSPVAHRIYWRVLSQTLYSVKFTGWAIGEFHGHGDFKSAIKYFLLNFSKITPANPGATIYHLTIDCVVGAVEELKGFKAGEVLRTLCDMSCRDGFKIGIRSRWPMKLLHAYWRRGHDFPGTLALFDEMLSLGMLENVSHPMGVYRSMVEISIKAGENDMAKYFYDEVIKKFPDMTNDVALKGFVAWAFAQIGDWDSVYEAFAEMQTLKDGQESQYAISFIEVLKLFVRTHSAPETRDFVSKYLTDLHGYMHRNIVTIVAKKYAADRDTSGFMSWLAYCSSVGFALDSGVCNVVLHCCSTRWKLPYPQLLALYRNLRQLDPTFVNDVTRRIMSKAALVASSSFRESKIIHSSGSTAVLRNTVWRHARTVRKLDVRIAMIQELKKDKPEKALSIYERASQQGMPFCPYCFRLFIVANLKIPEKGSSSAMTLIETAHGQGKEVGSAVSEFIRFQLVNMQVGADDMLFVMRNIISQFEAMHIVLEASVLIEMASICVSLGHLEKAIELCKLATDRRNKASICFSRHGVWVLLTAYSRLLDTKGLKNLIDDILASQFYADKRILSHLVSNRRAFRKFPRNGTVKALLAILGRGIKEMKSRRAETMVNAKVISQETLRIMQDALADTQRNKTSHDAGENEHAQQHQIAIEA